MHSLLCNLCNLCNLWRALRNRFLDNSPLDNLPRQLAPDLQTSGPKYENTYVMLDIYIYIYTIM